MNYTTVVFDLFSRFPKLAAIYRAEFASMEHEEPSPYIVFGSILKPALSAALESGDLARIVPLCAFLEDASVAAREDNSLHGLMKVEMAEWLGWVDNEDRLTPWLGSATKRICNYTPGLATQRRQLRAEKQARTIFARVAAMLQRLKLT